MLTGHAATLLSHRSEHACLFDWEDPQLEQNRMIRMGVNVENVHAYKMSGPLDLGEVQERIVGEVKRTAARFVVLGPYILLAPDASRSADAWNDAVKDVVAFCRRLIAETGCTVVVLDHQDDPEMERAHGGRSKMWLCDVYLRIKPLTKDWEPGLPYRFALKNLKPSRLHIPALEGVFEGPKDGPIRFRWTKGVTEPPAIAGSVVGWTGAVEMTARVAECRCCHAITIVHEGDAPRRCWRCPWEIHGCCDGGMWLTPGSDKPLGGSVDPRALS
jgi:hypothetical protein